MPPFVYQNPYNRFGHFPSYNYYVPRITYRAGFSYIPGDEFSPSNLAYSAINNVNSIPAPSGFCNTIGASLVSNQPSLPPVPVYGDPDATPPPMQTTGSPTDSPITVPPVPPITVGGGGGGSQDIIQRLGLTEENFRDGAYVNSQGYRFYRMSDGRALRVSADGNERKIINSNLSLSDVPDTNEGRANVALALGMGSLRLRPRSPGSNTFVDSEGAEYIVLPVANRAVIHRLVSAREGIIRDPETIEFNTAQANLGQRLATPGAGITIPSDNQISLIQSLNLRPRMSVDVVSNAVGGTATPHASGQWVQESNGSRVAGIFTLDGDELRYSGGSNGPNLYVAPPCRIVRRVEANGNVRPVWQARIGGAGNPTGPVGGPHEIQIGVPPPNNPNPNNPPPPLPQQFFIRDNNCTYIYRDNRWQLP